jgi:hypothetical protein
VPDFFLFARTYYHDPQSQSILVCTNFVTHVDLIWRRGFVYIVLRKPLIVLWLLFVCEWVHGTGISVRADRVLTLLRAGHGSR